MALSKYSSDKRQNILTVATELFLEKGFSGTSTTELLRRVGGSKTTIYSHFGDKAGLFTAVVDDVLKDTVAFSDSLDLKELSTRDAIIKIADQHLKIALSERYINLVRIAAAEVSSFPQIGRAFYEHGPATSYRNFQVFLKHRIALGDLKIKNVKLATDMLFGTLLHREFLARLYGATVSPVRDRSAIAITVADEFLDHYSKTVAGK